MSSCRSSARAKPSRCSISASAPAPSCWPSWPSGRPPAGWESTSPRTPWRWPAKTPPISAWRAAPLLRSDWTAGLDDDQFDLVVSNPPYIASVATSPSLPPEVRNHEPRLALDGGRDGLDAFRASPRRSCGCCKPGGRFAVEIGLGQRDAVRALFAAAGATELAVTRDLADRDRVVAGRKKGLG